MKKYDIAIIGGGASGLAAAISAARAANINGSRIKTVIFEAQPRVGKKILATGNGRCNLCNEDTQITHYRGDTQFASAVFSGPECDTQEFFRSLGLLLKSDDGRLYPLGGQASGVLDALRFEVDRLGCETLTDTKITSVKESGGAYILNNSFLADAVILCSGGKASVGECNGYTLLGQLGLTVTPLFPSLVRLVASEKNFKPLKGIRADGEIRIMSGGECLARDSGELQFTDCGISGIPAMQVSSAVARNAQHGGVYAVLDLCESLSREQLADFFLQRATSAPDARCEDVMTGIMPRRLGGVLLGELNIRADARAADALISHREALADTIKGWVIPLKGTNGFADAQVTSGGADTACFSSETLESKSHRGFFCAGELLDVDGECGGYNLHWAWCSGRRAGRCAAEYIIKKERKNA
ncbi:MAG: aminoacetone oxidase family FAD-binding enzyme [Clostridiales bacterium]|nr:aminoacetone oxidase family FAD-binding enzyme [Clostridiales bacterium]